jgi:hypothetical protein
MAIDTIKSTAVLDGSITGDDIATNLDLSDNKKIRFGDGNDLHIYHDESNSYVSDQGTGGLFLQGTGNVIIEQPDGTNFIQCNSSGWVRLHHGGSNRLETTSTGVDVTGDLQADGLTADGKTVVGSSSSNALEIHSSGDTEIAFSYATKGNIYGKIIGDITQGSPLGGEIAFQTADAGSLTERVRIKASGRLCLNATSPDTNAMLTIRPLSTDRIINTRNFSASTQYHHVFENSAGTTVGSIQCNNAATAYNTSSDYRLKENVTATWDATTRLKQLNPVRFNFISDADTTVDGFLAHEVQDIVPEAITGTKDAMRDEEYEVTPAVLDDDGNEVTPAVMGTRSVPDYQGIDQSKLVPLLVKTIKEQQSVIEDLTSRIVALEAN